MRRRVLPVLLAISALTIGSVTPAFASSRSTAAAARPASKLEMGFFEQWSIYGRGFSLAQADHEGEIADLTDIDYAFGGALPVQGATTDPSASNPVSCQSLDTWADWGTPYLPDVDGGNPVGANGLAGNFQQLVELKAKYPGSARDHVARRLQRIQVLLRRRRHPGLPTGFRLLLHRPVHQGQPARARPRSRRRHLRRLRSGLGVSGQQQRRAGQPLQRRPTCTTSRYWRPSSGASWTR